MFLEEYKLLFYWVKGMTECKLNWTSDTPAIPIIWEGLELCINGQLFLDILIIINPDYFCRPLGSDLIGHMFKQIKKFLYDFHLFPDNLLGRLKVNFSEETTKWELSELIFLISYVSAAVQGKSFYESIINTPKYFPSTFKISLKILLRTLEKLKIPDFVEICSPKKEKREIVEFSSNKRRRQDELLRENQEQRAIISDFKKRYEELENDYRNLKNSSELISKINQNDSNILSKLYSLEKKISKQQDLIDDFHREKMDFKCKHERLQDEYDIILSQTSDLEKQLRKYQELQKKFEDFSKVEKKLKDCEKSLKESYFDKELLLVEINQLRRGSANTKTLLDQISKLTAENQEISQQLLDSQRKFQDLETSYKRVVEKAVFPPFPPSDSQSVISSCPGETSLLYEELQVQITKLEIENSYLKTQAKEYESQLELNQNIKNFGTNAEVYMLKYSRLESELFETRLKLKDRIESLQSDLEENKRSLLQSNHEKNRFLNENIEFKERLAKYEKQLFDSSESLEKLRTENFKLRDSINKLKASNEVDILRSENSRLLKDVTRLTNEASENFQSNLSLKAENQYLYNLLEETKTEKLYIEKNTTEDLKGDFFPLTDFVIPRQIEKLEKMIGKDDLLSELAHYIMELKKSDKVVSTNSQQIIDNLKDDKNKIISQLHEEIKKRLEAEKKSLTFLKKLRQYEELR